MSIIFIILRLRRKFIQCYDSESYKSFKFSITAQNCYALYIYKMQMISTKNKVEISLEI